MSDESKGLTKWRAALLVGVGAVALAGGALLVYALVRRRRSPVGNQTEETVQNENKTSATNKTSKTESTETPATTTQTTLERARAIKQQGNEFYKQQKFDEAIKCYEEAIRVCPATKKEDMAIFHQNLAAVYDMMATKSTDPNLKTSHLHQVMENCTRAFELNPRYIKALTRRLKVFETLNRKKDAILDVTRVLVLDESQGKSLSQTVAKLLKDFGHQQAKENFPLLGPLAPTKHPVKTYFESFSWSDDLSDVKLKELWCGRIKTKPVVEPVVAQATEESTETPVISNDQSNGGEDDEAEVPTTNQLEERDESHDQEDKYSGFSDEPFVKAAIALREEKYHGILELLDEAITNGNAVFTPNALLLRGALLSLWRQDEKGLKDLQDVVNTQGLPKEMYTNALVKRAGIMAGLGEVEKCQTCFTKALAIDPSCADVYVYRARLILESEDQSFTQTVIEDLEKGLSLSPSSPHAAYLLASAYHRIAGMNQSMQILETAKVKFGEAVQKFPNFADGLLLYSMFLQDTNQFKEAEEILNKVVKLQPENPISHFTLGLLSLMYNQDMDKAVSCMETAIATDSSCVQAYNTLATIEMQRGNAKRAMELYDKAIHFSRSEMEMSQAYVSREVVNAQEQACKEYGISPADLAARAYGGGGY